MTYGLMSGQDYPRNRRAYRQVNTANSSTVPKTTQPNRQVRMYHSGGPPRLGAGGPGASWTPRCERPAIRRKNSAFDAKMPTHMAMKLFQWNWAHEQFAAGSRIQRDEIHLATTMFSSVPAVRMAIKMPTTTATTMITSEFISSLTSGKAVSDSMPAFVVPASVLEIQDANHTRESRSK